MGKKATIALLAAFSLMLVSQASGQTFDWIRDVGKPLNGRGGRIIEAIAVDSGGGNYFTGSFDTDTFTFANDTGSTNFGFYSRLNNLTIGKYSTNGTPVWGYSPTAIGGGIGGEDIAYYRGHIYVTGTFGDTVAFSSADTLIANNIGSAFIMKMDTSGNVKWVTKQDSVESNCIAVRGSSVVIGGLKEDFGRTDTFNHFFARYDTTGKLVKTISSKNKPFTTRYQEVTAVGIDRNGNIIGGGDFKDSLTFGSTQITKFKGSGNDQDGFLVKFDKNLKVQWMERLGDGSFNGREKVNNIYVEDGGKFYATGEYVDSFFYRSNAFSGGGAGAKAFIGEFQSSGTLNWFSKITASGAGYAIGSAVATTADSVFAVGRVEGSSASFGNKTRSRFGYYFDFYVAKLDKKGNFKYAATSSGRSGRFGRNGGGYYPLADIGLDSSQAAYISGGYQSNIAFGSQFVSGKSQNFVTKLTNQRIILDTLSDSTFCPGDSVQAPFRVTGNFNPSNTFTAQLSDSSGQFQSPILLDSVQGQTGDTIRTIIPETVPADSQYRIRIVSDAPANTSNLNPATLTIKKQPGLSVNDLTVSCGTDSVKPNVTTSGSRFSWSPASAVSNPTAKRPYVFTSADTVSLEVKDSIGCVNRDTLMVTTKSDSLQPPGLTKLNTQSTSSIRVKWDTPDSFANFRRYVLYRKAAKRQTFSAVDSIPAFDSTSLLDQNVSATDSLTYDYFIRAQNGCGTLSDTSNTLRSIALKSHTLSDKKLQVKWNPSLFDDSVKYQVERDPGSGFRLDSTFFRDTTYQRIACDNSGTYEITAIDTATNDTVISNRISPAVKDTTPPPASLLSASRFGLGQEPTYRLTLDQSDSGDFKESVIFQSVNNGAYQPLDTLGNANGVINTYSKPAYPDSNNVCFRIQPTDTCGNQGPRSSPHCLIDLEGRPGNKENQLSWTSYKGFQADTVEVQRFQNGSWQNLAYLAGSDTTYRHQDLTCRDTFQYRIKYQEAGGNGQISYSDSIQLSPFDTTQPAVPEIKYASFNFNFNGLANLAFEPLSANVDRYIVRVEGQNGQPQRFDTIYGSSDTTYRDAYADPIEEVKCYTIQAQNVTCDSVYTTESKAHCLPLLQAEKIRCTPAVRLSWTPYQGFDSFGGYAIGIKADSISGLRVVGRVNQGTTSFIHRDADTGVTYQYQVRVRDGTIFPLEPVSSTAVLVNKPALPEPPTVLGASKIATGNTNGQVKLNWQTFTDKQGLDHFKLYHKPSSQNQFSVLKSSIPLTQDSFIHKGLNTRSRNHQYYLTTVDSCGRESDSTRVQTTINLSLTLKELRHELQWTPYKGFEVERVKIQRAFGDGAFNTIGSQSIFTSLGTSFIDTNVRCGEQYSYRIKALGPEGAFAFSDTVTGTAFDNTPPDRPDLHRASVSFTDNTGGQIELRYRGAPQANTEGYTIARKAASSSGFRVIDSFRLNGTDSLTYTDDPVNTYTQAQNYYLKAYDRCGNISLPSDTHRTINLSADPANGYIQLSWNAYFGWGFRTYKLQRKESLNSWETIQDLETGDLSYRDSQVICNNIYQYRIIGEERTTGYRSFSNTDTAKAYEINPPLPAQIRRVSVSTTSQTNGATLLTWNPSLTANTLRSVLYRKGQNQDTYRPIDTVERYRYRDSPVNTTGQYYDYRLKAIDQCLVPSDSFSPAHRSIHLTATGGNEQIRLDWNAYRGDEVRAYKVLRGQEVLTSTAPGRTSLVDEQVTCDTTYRYQIKAVLEGGTKVSLSNRDQARSIHNKGPEPPYLQRATVTSFNDVVEVKWKPSDAYTIEGYEVFREQGSRLSKIAQINDPDRTFATDSFAIPEQQSVCYYVRALDACGNESELSNRGCLIQPTAEALDLENRVFWPAYRKWEEGVRAYEVFKQLANGSYTAFANLDSNARQYPDKALRDSADQFCYYVRAEGFGEETFSRSTRVCLEQSAVVYIPNTFTPVTTQSLNDEFGPEGLYIDNYQMQVYNRWGEQVFSTSTSEEWDGTYRGEVVPQGVYHFQIRITSDNGRTKNFSGQVTVIR
jgi:gliding motility-associated-like protein